MGSTNFLSYTNATYDDIVAAINTKITSDSRFANYNDTTIASMINQIIAATTDFLNFNMDACFNENFFQTAQLRSSVIKLSRNLGYTIQRPIAATAKMRVKLYGDFSGYGFIAGDTIQIPYHSKFTYSDSNFILKDSLYIMLTSQMISDMTSLGGSYSQLVDVDYKGEDIVVVEGTIKEKIITGTNNPLAGKIFQMYKISDSTFSNHYSDTDFNNEVTKVYCGVNKDRKYSIDKRSVINWENFTSESFNDVNDICVVRTGSDEGVEILFGDGIYSNIGAITTNESVWISYLSTQGSKGNQSGLIGEVLTFAGKVYSSRNTDLTGKVEFQFKTNPTGGSDLESIDSIKMNAPSIYYSLDRLVTAKDYTNYLKSLTSPISIKNALAWGEQDEIIKHVPVVASDIKMFNIVLFTALGSLYNLEVSPYAAREIDSNLNLAVLDSNYNEDEVPIRGYFNIYMRQSNIDQLLEYSTSASYWKMIGTSTTTTTDLTTASRNVLASTYGSTAPVNVQYFSTSTETTIIGTSALTITVSDMGVYSTGTAGLIAAMDTIASRITTALRTIVDQRGLTATNPSRGQFALPTITCYYNSDSNVFETSASTSDPCYLYNLSGAFISDIGMIDRPPTIDIKTITDYISDNIKTVRTAIQDRSQVTVNSVYLSPIIHTFNLSGTVYVNPLYDIGTVKTEVEDSMYSFFDANADFNSPIYLSNVVELIEKNNGVKYCDVGFGVTYPSRTDGQLYTAVELAKPEYSNWESIYSGIGFYLLIYSYTIIYSAILAETPNVTERSILKALKEMYDQCLIQYPLYANSNDFLNMCTAIRKDTVQYIRTNLINTYGNIGEGIIQPNGSTYYAFSVGTEIVKIRCNMTYQYKG